MRQSRVKRRFADTTKPEENMKALLNGTDFRRVGATSLLWGDR